MATLGLVNVGALAIGSLAAPRLDAEALLVEASSRRGEAGALLEILRQASRD